MNKMPESVFKGEVKVQLRSLASSIRIAEVKTV